MAISVRALNGESLSPGINVASKDLPEGSTRFVRRAAFRLQTILAQVAERSQQTRRGYSFQVLDRPDLRDARQVTLAWGPEDQRSISVVVTSEYLTVRNFERDPYSVNPVEFAQGLRVRDMYSVEGRRRLQAFFNGKVNRTTAPYVPAERSPFN